MRRSHAGNAVLRLIRQMAMCEFEAAEYGVKKLRFKSYWDQICDELYWDFPYRSNSGRNWKRHRNYQHKD